MLARSHHWLLGVILLLLLTACGSGAGEGGAGLGATALPPPTVTGDSPGVSATPTIVYLADPNQPALPLDRMRAAGVTVVTSVEDLPAAAARADAVIIDQGQLDRVQAGYWRALYWQGVVLAGVNIPMAQLVAHVSGPSASSPSGFREDWGGRTFYSVLAQTEQGRRPSAMSDQLPRPELLVTLLHQTIVEKRSTATSTVTRSSLVAPTPDTRPLSRIDAFDDIWQAFQARPLRLPTLSPQHPCPVSPVTTLRDTPLLGGGPIYPVSMFGHDGVLRYTQHGVEEAGWHLTKVPWLADGEYSGPALIRGRQLDGPGEVRFKRGDASPTDLIAELQFPMHTGVSASDLPLGWRFLPSAVAVQGPGCYALQIDGVNFTRLLVFQAVP